MPGQAPSSCTLCISSQMMQITMKISPVYLSINLPTTFFVINYFYRIISLSDLNVSSSLMVKLLASIEIFAKRGGAYPKDRRGYKELEDRYT